MKIRGFIIILFSIILSFLLVKKGGEDLVAMPPGRTSNTQKGCLGKTGSL